MSKRRPWFSCSFLAVLAMAALAPVAASADPVITGFNSNVRTLNAILIIYGSDFGTAQGENYVKIANRQVPAIAWSDVAIYAIVNPFAYDPTPLALDTLQPVQVIKPRAGKASNIAFITISSGPIPLTTSTEVTAPARSDQPTVTSFQRSQFCPGNDIAIYGAGFGDAMGMSFITITVPFLDSHGNPFTQEFAIPVLNWTENAIDAVLNLPSGALFGSYTLTVHRSTGSTTFKTSSGPFTVVPCHP